MRRRTLFSIAAIAVGVAAAVAGVVLGDRDGGAPAVDVRLAKAEASVEPQVQLFGDTLTATLQVLVDRRRVDPESVRVEAAFAPYSLVSPMRREVLDSGTTRRLRYRYRLACLRRACLPGRNRRQVTMPVAVVAFTVPALRQRERVIALWPPVTIISRIGARKLETQRLAATLAPLPGATYRISPAALTALLAAAAALLALAAAVVLARMVPRRTAPAIPQHVEADARPPLEAALGLVERALARADPEEERKALERLARELGRSGEPELARVARRLAWSERPPAHGEIGALTRQVEQAMRDGAG